MEKKSWSVTREDQNTWTKSYNGLLQSPHCETSEVLFFFLNDAEDCLIKATELSMFC